MFYDVLNKLNHNPLTSEIISELESLGLMDTENRMNTLKELLSFELHRSNYPEEYEDGLNPKGLVRLLKSQTDMNKALTTGRCVLSLDTPDIKLVSGFLSKDTVELLNAIFDARMEQSYEVSEISDGEILDPTLRDSKTLWLDPQKDFVIRPSPLSEIQNRLYDEVLDLSALENAKEISNEPFQIVDYAIGQQYTPHFDEHNLVKAGTSRRITTCLLYLKTPNMGGGTTFTDLGLTLTPNVGDLILFSYLTENSLTHPLTRHSGDMVIDGSKRIMTLWIHVNT